MLERFFWYITVLLFTIFWKIINIKINGGEFTIEQSYAIAGMVSGLINVIIIDLMLQFNRKVVKIDKSNFYFLNNDGSKKEPKYNDLYFNYEWKLKSKFPFVHKQLICYTFMDDKWIKEKQ